MRKAEEILNKIEIAFAVITYPLFVYGFYRFVIAYLDGRI